MVRVDRRLLAWIVSAVLVCIGVFVAVRAVWPFAFSGDFAGGGVGPVGGGGGSVSVAFPSVTALPLVVLNIVLSVIARRRGGRAGSIGSFFLWTIGVVVVVALAVSLTPVRVLESANTVFFIVLLMLLAVLGSLPMQLLILALLTFVLIGGSRVPY